MQIYVLSGAIQSGKTTYLMNYVEQHKNCCGVLSPIINGKRTFYSIHSKVYQPMEANPEETEILEIGKYKFSKSAFDWAVHELEERLTNQNEILILDEIGPLEMKNQGFAALLKRILKGEFQLETLLLVIRETARIDILNYFGIKQEEVLTWKWKS